MTIDIKKLSASQLFELAKRKEKEEQQVTQRSTRLAEIRKQIATLIASHQEALAATDKAISELQEKRAHLVSEFKAAITPLELDIRELERKVKSDQPTAEPSSASAPPPDTIHTEEIVLSTVPSEGTPASINTPPEEPQPTPQEVAESSSPPPDSSQELLAKIRDIMRSRTYISESLLKEKLKTNGFDVRNLKQDIEKLIREGKLEKKGIGNYALGKKK